MGFLSDIAGIAGTVIGGVFGGPAGAAIGGSIGGAIGGSSAQEEATKAGTQATDAAIAEQRAAREAFEARTQPFLDIGAAGGQQLQSFLQTPQQDTTQRLQSFLDDPTQQLAEINPIVDFLRQQGFEQIQESAAARGRLGAGGTLQDLTRFDVGLTSTVVPQLQAQRFNQLTSLGQQQSQLQNQRFNQLFNVAGLGANVAAGQGTAALQTGANVSNLLNVGGQQQQAGILGQQQAIQGGVENIFGAAGAFPNLFGTGQQSPAPVTDLSFGGRPATSTVPSF